jgi:uncharacterized protein DUF3857
MNSKLSCSRSAFLRGIDQLGLGSVLAALAISLLALPSPTQAGDAPQWMHALVNVPLPEHDEKTDAVLLLAEDNFTVQGNGKMKRIERRVYKILRPDGRAYGTIYANFDAETKINSIHGWCIPAQGKDYEVKDKEAIETALFGVTDGILMSDLKTKVLTIPAADPGNIVGYELEQEVHPYVMQDVWRFQRIGVKQKVTALTSSAPTTLAKMQTLARFVQTDIRYVAIELGIGGLQPHPAAEIFSHHYGDCKDKAILLGSMLHEVGVESFPISINTTRGGAAPDRPPTEEWFNHEILAIRLPDDVKDPSLLAVIEHPKLGRILIFDPTDEWTPFGRLRGELQANYGLIVTGDGGELIKLPQLSAALNGVVRTAKLALSPSGTLSGDFMEQRNGDYGTQQRASLKSVSKDVDRIKFLESLISHSLPSFQITKASLLNLNQPDQPFGYQYSLVAQNYAKTAGNLLLVRPRVVGINTSDLLETKEQRRYPVEFDGPWKNSDSIEISIPAGYEVDDLPPPVNADYGFASYHSKTEVSGSTLKYTRTFEVKELSVPVNKVEELKKLYRIIAGDERNTAVLKPAGH